MKINKTNQKKIAIVAVAVVVALGVTLAVSTFAAGPKKAVKRPAAQQQSKKPQTKPGQPKKTTEKTVNLVENENIGIAGGGFSMTIKCRANTAKPTATSRTITRGESIILEYPAIAKSPSGSFRVKCGNGAGRVEKVRSPKKPDKATKQDKDGKQSVTDVS